MNKATKTIPIFPLGVVLFPGVHLPLHIFEERYKLMIGDCLQQGREFGVVFYTGESFHDVGCTATIVRELRRYEDGRLDILTRGTGRFKIVDLAKDKPYLTAEVEAFEDDEEGSEGIREKIQTTAALYEDLLQLATENAEAKLDLEMEPMELSFFISSYAGFTMEEKQKLLELTSTRERLTKIDAAIKTLFKRLKAKKRLEKIISGNGKLPRK